MKRLTKEPRPNWESIVESQGFHFHSLDDAPYWDESAYYSFFMSEIDAIERATYALDKMCLEAVQRVIDERMFDRFQIPPAFVDYVVDSWEHDELTIYGRFDLAYDGQGGSPKLLEYNADTPTALLESAVVQWFWLKDEYPALDQFNSIHERLIEAWQRFMTQSVRGRDPVYFSAMRGQIEDFMTVTYLRDTAMQAGLTTQYIDVEDIGWNASRNAFLDQSEQAIRNAFKLYPWEWMIREQFGPNLLAKSTHWLEAPWKMILSNKAILPVLYEMFPTSPYLLEASFEPIANAAHVRKPLLSREGANVTLFDAGGATTLETTGTYGGGPYIYQRLASVPNFDGNHPILGSWMVNGFACGMGIREDASPVTGNTSRFVPHVIAK